MKTRTALSVALSALMVFSTIPTGAIKAIADEVTPQVEAVNTPDATDVVNDEGAATDVVGEGESSDQQDAVAVDEQQADTEEPASGDEKATAEEEPSDEEDAAEEKDDADKVLLAAAADGDGGPLRGAPVPNTRDTVDTKALGITVNMFDYEITDAVANSYTRDTRDTGGINTGKSRFSQLNFYGTGDGVNNTQLGVNPGNGINQFTGGWTQNGKTTYDLQVANQGIVQSQLSRDGYPLVNTPGNNDKTTNYLFDPSGSYDDSSKRTTYANVNHLFYLKGEGAEEKLVYDSNESYAVFNNDSSTFTVYNGTYERARHDGDNSRGMKVGFFPFDPWWTGNGSPEINPNYTNDKVVHDVHHHFGLTLDFPITMPLDGMIHTKDGEEAPMVFEFSGDDDMWVFVDGKLVLDIGGIHQPVRGTINFATGVIELSSGTAVPKNDQGGHYSYTAHGINPDNDADRLVRGDRVYLWNGTYDGVYHQGILGDRNSSENRAGTSHRVQAFYLERGGCDSNLLITTNIHLMTKVKASVQKEWDNGIPNDRRFARMQLVRKEIPRGNEDEAKFISRIEWIRELDSSNDWTATWEDLDREGWSTADPNVYCKYEYYVREIPEAGFEPLFSNASEGSSWNFPGTPETIYDYARENLREYSSVVYPVDPESPVVKVRNIPTYLDVTKEWKNAEGTGADTESHVNDSVWVQLYKQTLTSEESEVWSEETPVGDPVELKESSETPWTHRYEIEDTGDNVRYFVKEGTKVGDTFTPLPANGVIRAAKTSGEDTGRPYVWHSTTYKNKTLVVGEDGSISWNESDPKEVTPQTPADSPDQYVTVPHHGSASATIANKPVVTKITVQKVWSDGTAAQHPGVWVQLYKDGDKVGTPVEVTDGAKHVFEGLVPTGVYTVEEGTYANGTFTPQESFDLTTTDGRTMVYVQDSVKYYAAGSEEPRTQNNLDGKVYPDAGSVVITNKPLQADISLKKVDADSEGGTATISGVKFKLLKDKSEAGVYEPAIDIDVVKDDITTGPDGTASLPKLDPGTYWLLETEAADGYLMRDPNHPIGITVTASGTSLAVSLIEDSDDTEKIKPSLVDPDSDGKYTLIARNVRTYSLPSAGGPGVYPFLLVGSFAAAYAARDALDKRKSPSRSQSRRGRPGDF